MIKSYDLKNLEDGLIEVDARPGGYYFLNGCTGLTGSGGLLYEKVFYGRIFSYDRGDRPPEIPP